MAGGLHLPHGAQGGGPSGPFPDAIGVNMIEMIAMGINKLGAVASRSEIAVMHMTLTEEQEQALKAEQRISPNPNNWLGFLGAQMQFLERGVVAMERIADALEAEVEQTNLMAAMMSPDGEEGDEESEAVEFTEGDAQELDSQA